MMLAHSTIHQIIHQTVGQIQSMMVAGPAGRAGTRLGILFAILLGIWPQAINPISARIVGVEIGFIHKTF